MLRPTSYLNVALSSENANSDMASAIKRAFSYLAPTTIVKNNVEVDAPDVNVLKLDVRLPAHPFMNAGDPESDRVWSEVVTPWLKTKLNTLFGTVYEFNNESRRSFAGKLDYATFELVLEGHTFCFRLEPDSSLRPFERVLDAIRSWLTKEESDGFSVKGIEIPSIAELDPADADWFEVQLACGEQLRVPLA